MATIIQSYYPIVAKLMVISCVYLTTTATELECTGHSRKYLSVDPYGNPICKKCSKCPPGTGVRRICEGTHDTECELCPKGTYSGTWSSARVCQPCQVCSPHRKYTRDCTSQQNSQCSDNCDFGFYLNPLTDVCDECSWCYPNQPSRSPTRVTECILQGLPRDFQCMPTAGSNHHYNLQHDNIVTSQGGSEVASTDVRTHENKADDIFTAHVHNGNMLSVECTSSNQIKLFIPTSEQHTPNRNTSSNSFGVESQKRSSILIIISSVVVCICVVLSIVLLLWCRRRKQPKYTNNPENEVVFVVNTDVDETESMIGPCVSQNPCQCQGDCACVLVTEDGESTDENNNDSASEASDSGSKQERYDDVIGSETV